jgi:hypothetical protein
MGYVYVHEIYSYSQAETIIVEPEDINALSGKQTCRVTIEELLETVVSTGFAMTLYIYCIQPVENCESQSQ